jgi:hypothetical protein
MSGTHLSRNGRRSDKAPSRIVWCQPPIGMLRTQTSEPSTARCVYHLSRSPARLIRRDEGHDIGHIGGLTDTREHRQSFRAGTGLWHRHPRRIHVGLRDARHDRIHSDAARTELRRKRQCQSLKRTFRCCVGGMGRRGDARETRRNVDNTSIVADVVGESLDRVRSTLMTGRAPSAGLCASTSPARPTACPSPPDTAA